MENQEQGNPIKKGPSEKKEPPRGKVTSTDYRDLFQGEKEHREKTTPPSSPAPEPPKEKTPSRRSAGSGVKAAVKAAQEGLDLLQEEPPEDPRREEGTPPEEPRLRARGKHRAPALIVGVVVLLLALVGVGYLATTLGTQIYRAATDDSRERAYDAFLRPLVMQDPEPFSSQENADSRMMLNASLWKALEDNSASYTEYDEAGRTLVPLADVSDACHALFGPEAELQLNGLDDDTFFTFDESANQFHVTPYSTQSSFVPYTESIWNEEGNTVLRVGYVAPTDSWRNQGESAAEAPTPVKYMEYVLTAGENGEYVSQVREPAQGSEPVSSS